jgi:predicted phage terminase large subunit-like protein
MGSPTFSAQYQQNPVYDQGNFIRPHWFGRYEGPIARTEFQLVVQSWDTAMTAEPTSDFTVCTTWGFRNSKWHLLHVLRRRLEYPDIKRAIQGQHRDWQPELILIEDAATGTPLFQELSREGMRMIAACRPDIGKEERVIAQSAKLEAGLVLIPQSADWLEDFLHEARAFPSGRYDDQVDSMTMFLWWTTCYGGLCWQRRMLNDGRPPGPINGERPRGYSYRSRRQA